MDQGMDQALAFGVTNFAWASGYALGVPLGGALVEPEAPLPPTPSSRWSAS